ncbi:hypothetical protein ACKWTF_002673 [Chironomus riparius]
MSDQSFNWRATISNYSSKDIIEENRSTVWTLKGTEQLETYYRINEKIKKITGILLRKRLKMQRDMPRKMRMPSQQNFAAGGSYGRKESIAGTIFKETNVVTC